MAEINFPSNPSNNDTHTDIINGIVWTYSSSGGWAKPNVAEGTPDSFITGDDARDNIVVGEDPVFLTGSSGVKNTVLGFETGEALSTGSNNTVVGAEAGKALDSSIGNTVVGAEAGLTLTIGSQFNTIIGYLAGKTQDTVHNNVIIGYSANVKQNFDTNSIVIGSVAVGQGPNSAVLGNDQITATYLKGAVHFKTPSYLVAALPDPTAVAPGTLVWVTDDITVAGGVHASCNGTNWVLAGTATPVSDV